MQIEAGIRYLEVRVRILSQKCKSIEIFLFRKLNGIRRFVFFTLAQTVQNLQASSIFLVQSPTMNTNQLMNIHIYKKKIFKKLEPTLMTLKGVQNI